MLDVDLHDKRIDRLEHSQQLQGNPADRSEIVDRASVELYGKRAVGDGRRLKTDNAFHH